MSPHAYRILPYLSVTLLVAWACPAGAEAAGFDRAGWLRDYAVLKHSLERDYANLAWFASPQGGVDLPAADRLAQRNLRAAENDAQARMAIEDFVASFHDGHLSTLPALLASDELTDEPPLLRLGSLDAASGCAALGEEGKYASNTQISFSLPFESLPGFELDSDGLSRPFRSGTLVAADGTRIGLLRIKSFLPMEYPQTCLTAWPKALAASGTGDDDRLRAFVTAYNEDEWYSTLAWQLERFHDSRVSVVVVDIGNNHGGDDSGDTATRLFTDQPVHSSRLLVSQSPTGMAYLDEKISGLREALNAHPNTDAERALRESLARFLSAKKHLQDDACDLHWVWQTQRDWNGGRCRRLIDAGSAAGPLDYAAASAFGDADIAKHLHWPTRMNDHWAAWRGPVYVLTDARSHSSAEMFAATLQNNRLARTVGERTGGDGCGFMGESDPVVLPYSRMRIRIPNCVRLRADGSDEVAGILPDLPVSRREGESARARAQRVVTAVVEDHLASASRAP